MSLNKKIEKYFRVKKTLEKKLMSEGLTKDEKILLERVKSEIDEAPMTFGPEVGGARPSRALQSKIERGETPLSKFGLTQAQVDFFTSEAFKDSITRLEELLGRNSGVSRSLTLANRNLKTDAQNAFSTFMSVVGELMGELISLQMRNKEALEEIASESVERSMGIDREFFNSKLELDGKLTIGFLSRLEGMKDQVENISDEEIAEKFADIDEEKKQKIEDLRRDIESAGVEFDEEKVREAVESTFKISEKTLEKAKEEFSDEVSRRMIINMFRRGMSLYYANAYTICERKIADLPGGERILEISNVIQPIMLHMYWLFGDIGAVGRSGGGQIGQIQVKPPKSEDNSEESKNDSEESGEEPKKSEENTPKKSSGPFIIEARASTLPLLIHELIKGVVMFFTSAGGGKGREQRELTKRAATSLETEAYDLVYSEKFYIEFYKIYNRLVPNVDEQRELTPFLLKFLSSEGKEKLFKLTKSLLTLGLEDPGFSEKYIQELVNKSRDLRKQMEQNPSYMVKKQYGKPDEDEDEDDWDDDMSWLDDLQENKVKLTESELVSLIERLVKENNRNLRVGRKH
jgi:hypothetical protein